MRSLTPRWFASRSLWAVSDEPVPREVIFMRTLGLGYMVLFPIVTATTEPRPALHGRGLAVAVAMVVLVTAVLVTQPRAVIPDRRRIAGLLAITASSLVLAAVQPDGMWAASPYFVGVVAAMRLPKRAGVRVFALSLLSLAVVAAVRSDLASVASALVGAVPWFLVMRLIRRTHEQNVALEQSRAAEATAAAAAERGRVAREMHDVLAHSLSALALQLESTRLRARECGVPEDLESAIGHAHHLAVGGLNEARRAISATRGDELAGPERLGSLAEAFGDQSGLPIDLDVRGEPRRLPPDAGLAVYRTAQEALTNIRRHAAAERVRLRLDYRPEETVLLIEDHGAANAPPPPPLAATGPGYGLTGMRERAELLGGRLLAEPTGDGFRVELRLPA
ncbi:MAG: sensor histidine kinase [Solirubrobacteraceae bacterium]